MSFLAPSAISSGADIMAGALASNRERGRMGFSASQPVRSSVAASAAAAAPPSGHKFLTPKDKHMRGYISVICGGKVGLFISFAKQEGGPVQSNQDVNSVPLKTKKEVDQRVQLLRAKQAKLHIDFPYLYTNSYTILPENEDIVCMKLDAEFSCDESAVVLLNKDDILSIGNFQWGAMKLPSGEMCAYTNDPLPQGFSPWLHNFILHLESQTSITLSSFLNRNSLDCTRVNMGTTTEVGPTEYKFPNRRNRHIHSDPDLISTVPGVNYHSPTPSYPSGRFFIVYYEDGQKKSTSVSVKHNTGDKSDAIRVARLNAESQQKSRLSASQVPSGGLPWCTTVTVRPRPDYSSCPTAYMTLDKAMMGNLDAKGWTIGNRLSGVVAFHCPKLVCFALSPSIFAHFKTREEADLALYKHNQEGNSINPHRLVPGLVNKEPRDCRMMKLMPAKRMASWMGASRFTRSLMRWSSLSQSVRMLVMLGTSRPFQNTCAVGVLSPSMVREPWIAVVMR